MYRLRLKSALLVCCLGLLLCACQQKSVQKIGGEAFGTYYVVSYVGENDENLPHQVDSILKEINQLYSIFDTTSLISRLNRNESVESTSDFVKLLQQSLQISAETDGAFDVTVGPLVTLWGFGNKQGVSVTPSAIDSVRQFVGYKKVSIGENGQIVKMDSRIQFDFNAIAKGKAVDEVAQFLLKKGYQNVLVDIGGEVRAEGKKNRGKMWRVGIQIPTETSEGTIETDYVFEMSGKSVATSGNYRNYTEVDGERFMHITDPRTGNCHVSNLLSVTVIADECAVADAYATAFMVMGMDAAMQFLTNHPELAAHFVYFEKGEYHYRQTENFPSCVDD